MAPRGRRYEQGSFITNLAPSVTGKRSEKTIAGYGAEKIGRDKKAGDDGMEITAWPEAEYCGDNVLFRDWSKAIVCRIPGFQLQNEIGRGNRS